MKRVLNKTILSFDNALLTVSAVFYLVATMLATINAIMRALGMGGFAWTDESCVILNLFVVFLTQPILEFSDRQLSVEFLDNVVKNKAAKEILAVIRSVIIIAVVVFISHFCWETVQRSMSLNFLTSVLRIPRYLLYGCMFASFVLTVVNWAIKMFGMFAGDGKSSIGGEDSPDI